MTPLDSRANLKMKMAFKFANGIAGLALAAGLLWACGRPQLPAVTQADASRMSTTWPGVTVASLEQGRTLYNAHCSSCHLPVSPHKFSARAWPQHVSEMKERANLSDDVAVEIERYLVTIAGRPRR